MCSFFTLFFTPRSQLENKIDKKPSPIVEKNKAMTSSVKVKINDASSILPKERKVVDCTRSLQRKATPGGRGKITMANIFLYEIFNKYMKYNHYFFVRHSVIHTLPSG